MLNIAVTGLNACDTPAPGMPVIRCLKEHPDWDGYVTGLAYDALESGILDRRTIDCAYLLPYPKSGRDILIERLKYINAKQQIDVIIPTLDAELLNFIQIKDELSSLGIKTFLPTESQFTRRTKVNLDKLSKDTGIKTPRTILVTDPGTVNLKKGDLPVMVKGLFYEAYKAHTMDEVKQYMFKIADRWGYPVLIQEYLEGEEFNAAAVGNGKGQMSGIACMKKIIFTDKGKGWACVSIKNDELIGLTEKIISSLKWRGAIEVEAVYSKKYNSFYLIEINPRFPAWIYLAKASGINLPYIYLRHALGEEVDPEFDYKTGVVFSNYTTNLIADISRIETLFTKGEIAYEKDIREAVYQERTRRYY